MKHLDTLTLGQLRMAMTSGIWSPNNTKLQNHYSITTIYIHTILSSSHDHSFLTIFYHLSQETNCHPWENSRRQTGWKIGAAFQQGLYVHHWMCTLNIRNMCANTQYSSHYIICPILQSPAVQIQIEKGIGYPPAMSDRTRYVCLDINADLPFYPGRSNLKIYCNTIHLLLLTPDLFLIWYVLFVMLHRWYHLLTLFPSLGFILWEHSMFRVANRNKRRKTFLTHLYIRWYLQRLSFEFVRSWKQDTTHYNSCYWCSI